MEFDQVHVWWDEESKYLVEVNVAGGSRPGSRPNKGRKFYDVYQKILHDYFGKPPVYDEKDFLRRFLMPHTVFQRVYDSPSIQRNFLQNTVAPGNTSIHPLQRITSALLFMSYGVATDSVGEYVRLLEMSAIKSLK